MTMSSDQNAELVLRARQALDQQVADLDEDVGLRLATARRKAVAEMDRPAVLIRNPWVPVAAAATLMLAVGIWSMRTAPPALPVYKGEDAQMAAQNMELLSEMEFVAWLVEEEELNAG
jgi:Protein of unknown function (DUF3619)